MFTVQPEVGLSRAFIQMEPRKESIDREASVEKAAARLRIALVCACKQAVVTLWCRGRRG
jgi:hypothetical protein